MHECKNLWIEYVQKKVYERGLDVSKIKKYKVAICSIKPIYSIVRFFLRGNMFSL